MKKIFTLCAGALALAAAIGAQCAPLDVQTLSVGKVKNEDLRRFPFVVSTTEPRVATRINQWLFITNFETMAPVRAADGLREVTEQTWRSQPDMQYKVVRNDARVLSVEVSGESCGAYCEDYTVSYAFDATTGRHLEPTDLFTPDGLRAIAQQTHAANAARLRKEIATLRKANAAAHRKGPAADEDRDDKIALYEGCLAERAEASYRKMVGTGVMAVEAQGVRFEQSRCSNHAMRALDDLDGFSQRYGAAQLRPWLTPYGAAVLLGEATAPGPSSPFGQVLQGSIGTRLPVTLLLENPYDEGSVSATYFYDRVRKPISLSGQYRDGVLELAESESNGRLRLKVEGDSLVGDWSGNTVLPMRLAP